MDYLAKYNKHYGFAYHLSYILLIFMIGIALDKKPNYSEVFPVPKMRVGLFHQYCMESYLYTQDLSKLLRVFIFFVNCILKGTCYVEPSSFWIFNLFWLLIGLKFDQFLFTIVLLITIETCFLMDS